VLVALQAFGGVFSRFFVVGFFLPAFFGLVAVSQLLAEGTLPSGYRAEEGGTQILIIGALALLGGLLLSGVHHLVLRLFEGYPLQQLAEHGKRWRRLYDWAIDRWKRELAETRQQLEGPRSGKRTAAVVRLHTSYPPDEAELLPTRFGNIVRAFERHPNIRYGLDGVAVWPRISALLTEREVSDLSDRRADVALFLNGALVGGLTAVAAAIDGLANLRIGEVVAALGAAGVSVLLYLGSLNAAQRWGSAVRSAFDLHRGELYVKLGVKRPMTNADERDLAKAVSRLFLYAEEIPNAYREWSKES
jgi:hypothetical protein